MERLVEYIADEQLLLGRITDQDKKKLTITDPRGRASRVAPDKVLFRHSGASYEEVACRLEALQEEVDVQLLWETLLADEDLSAREAPELARIYFDDSSDAHSSAIFRALSADRLHFRRRGRTFEPRSAEELQRLQEQRQSEQNALSKKPLDEEHCQRIERHLRHGGDRPLAGILAQLSRTPERHAFDLLLQSGHLPPTADLEVIQANLRQRHPQSVLEHAASLTPVPGEDPLQLSAFTIDDAETREVDDALSICRDGDLLRVDIDIADVASLVAANDPVDQEALRRAVTIYLPTGTTFMLPEHLGCNLLSLQDGQPRPAMRTSVWLNSEGQIIRYQLQSTRIQVSQRLDYDTADQLLQGGEGQTTEALRLLDDIASKLAARRRADGAFSFHQREWKLHVSADGETITVKPLPHASPSRRMVAEMMILANRLAADYATQNDLGGRDDDPGQPPGCRLRGAERPAHHLQGPVSADRGASRCGSR
jgi:exoribonuclease-2